jgi:hypothetical protein
LIAAQLPSTVPVMTVHPRLGATGLPAGKASRG